MQETKQFPQRLAATAWHLADNGQGKIIGFSGTNDGHRLLPVEVHQSDPDEATLKATNGKMLAIILDNPCYGTILEETDPQSGQSKPLWQSLLDTAASMKMDALIDCGALLAGISIRCIVWQNGYDNALWIGIRRYRVMSKQSKTVFAACSKAAGYILPRLDFQRFMGVCFFNSKDKQWVVLEARGRCMPKGCSPVAERECFALFDDARCRGADLKVGAFARGKIECDAAPNIHPVVSPNKLSATSGLVDYSCHCIPVLEAASSTLARLLANHTKLAAPRFLFHPLQSTVCSTAAASRCCGLADLGSGHDQG
eukprot:1141567-Pelagomonas_calceolata.AAC.2